MSTHDELITPGDADAFLADFATLSAFGATGDGGVERQAATSAHADARSWLASWYRDNGFEVRFDHVGNLISTLTWDAQAPYFVVGSHLDSQPQAGRFDGAYGVLAGAHAARAVARSAIGSGWSPGYNLAVIDWFNEEGSRFKPSMMGSRVFCGLQTAESALATPDPAGVTVADALGAVGQVGAPSELEVAGYAELHIQQGRSLSAAGVQIGVVDSTWCAYKHEVVVRGEQGHSGAAEMDDRHDAVLGAAMVVVAARDLIDDFPRETIHTNVSELYVYPNSPVTIAREVRFLLDVRADSPATLEAAWALLLERLGAIESRARVDIEIESTTAWEASEFDQGFIEFIEQVCARLGVSSTRVPTVAGHDATNLKMLVPTGLIFVPSVEGLSHNTRELTGDEDLVAGLRVLTEVVAGGLAGHGHASRG